VRFNEIRYNLFIIVVIDRRVKGLEKSNGRSS